MPSFLSSLCDEPSPLIVWNSSTSSFNVCFTKVAFFLPAHAILAGVSAYFVGALKGVAGDASGRSASRSFFIRFLCCICLFVLSIIHFFLPAFYKHAQGFPSTVDLAVFLVVAASWLLHGVALFRRRRHDSDAGIKMASDVAMTIAYLFVLIPQALEARRAVIYLISHSLSTSPLPHDATIATPLALAKSIMDIIVCVFHLIYITSLIIAFVVVRIKKSRRRCINHLSEFNTLISEEVPSNISEDVLSIVDQRPSLIQPEDNTSVFSRICFGWVYPLLRDGANGRISENSDLYTLPSSISVTCLMRDLRAGLSPKNVTKDASTTVVHTSLFRALVHCFGRLYFSIGFLKLFIDVVSFVGPVVLHSLIEFMEDKSAPKWRGYGYALALLTTTATVTLINAQFQLAVGKIRLRMRAALVSFIYDQALGWSIATLSMSYLSTGEIVNAMSTDVERIINFCNFFHSAWSMPLQISIALYLLHKQISLAFLAGLAFALLVLPINKVLCDKILVFSSAMMAHKDKRIKLMSEILDGVRAIKFSAFEAAFNAKICHHRKAEVENLKRIKYLDAACVIFRASTPVIIALLSFLTYCYIYSYSTLTAAKIFTSLSLFNMLIEPLNMIPWVINGLVNAWVSLKRVQQLVNLKTDQDRKTSVITMELKPLIIMNNADFSWSLNENSFHLRGMTLTVPAKTLVGVVGKVGAGKTSLLHAIIGEMWQECGEVQRNWNYNDGIAFLPQQAWIQQGTIEENVLFGKPMDTSWYHTVLNACCLSEDVAFFPQRDKTNVGEKGLSLSGGQKQRLALARAIYAKKNFYIMDCPFSALDRRVREEVWRNVFLNLLKGSSTIIVASHYGADLFKMQELGYVADWVVIMKDGQIESQGPPSTLLDFVLTNDQQTEKLDTQQRAKKTEQGTSWEKLQDAEARESGRVAKQVYRSYWFAIGRNLAFSILVTLFLMQLSRNLCDWWLSYWAQHYSKNSTDPDKNETNTSKEIPNLVLSSFILISYDAPTLTSLSTTTESVSLLLLIYGIISALNLVITVARAFLFAYGGVEAARSLHDKLARQFFKAPLTFFESTPAGRVLNRFSSDLYSIDISLPYILNIFLAQIFGLAGVIILVSYSLPLFLILLLPIGVVYIRIQNFYRHTSREVKRLASVTLSPIYAHFTESLEGATIIKAMGEQDQFISKTIELVNQNIRAQYSQLIVAQWLSFNLKIIGVVIVFGASLAAILEHHFFSASMISPAIVGLSISYVLSVHERLTGLIFSFTETEKEMISVERVVDYINKIPEEDIISASALSNHCSLLSILPVTLDSVWPTSGGIVFKDVSLSYDSGTRMALDGVSFATAGGETIGVCGRTGSGKSSLLAALLRIHPIISGQILVDGVDVRVIPIHILRRRIAIVPQDPLLFTGSIRENLIPDSMVTEYNEDEGDETLRDLLLRCQLWDLVTSLGGLDAPLSPTSFSAGQKQLLGLARALRCHPKILCLDEATANVDVKTDQLLQMLIRNNCKGRTLLCISHRDDNFKNFDKMLVMKDGKIESFGKTFKNSI